MIQISHTIRINYLPDRSCAQPSRSGTYSMPHAAANRPQLGEGRPPPDRFRLKGLPETNQGAPTRPVDPAMGWFRGASASNNPRPAQGVADGG